MNKEPRFDLYLRLFQGREDCIAQQGQDFYIPISKALDEFYLRQHLDGNVTFGLYVLNKESRCHLFCVDIDIPKSELDGLDFSSRSTKYAYLKDKLASVLDTMYSLGVPRESILLEETGGRGYHVWVFLSDPIDGTAALAFGAKLKKHLTFEIEFFPKQGRLTEKRTYGNLIKLPLGLHRKYGSWSCFFTVSDDVPSFLEGLERNLAHLCLCKPVASEIIINVLGVYEDKSLFRKNFKSSVKDTNEQRLLYDGNPSLLITQCAAMSSIRDKANRGERLSRSEAFHLADVMLSTHNGEEYIHETVRSSFRQDYNKARTQDEISKIWPLHPPTCRTLVKKGICPAYCKESVRKRNEDPLGSGTTPCSVWLKKQSRKPIVDDADVMGRMGSSENIKSAFYQLQHYHENDDSLFFDTFDFEYFETHLDANCDVIAKVLLEKIDIPFTELLPVSLPKKLNDAGQLECRPMSYSTVNGYLPIQALFNAIAPILENNLQSTSYGYRWNMNAAVPYRVFEDWREAYPRFRNDIMTALKQHPSGYHVCCDIKGFYDHVSHNILLEQIRGIVLDDYIYKQIERTVRRYEFKSGSGKGVPQGPAYARLLANLYLNEFDVFAKGVSVAYFRYVDDFVLIFDDQQEAERGLERVVARLLELELELSDSDAKKAIIKSNTDLSRVRKALDKIQYGILEATHHVQYLTPKGVTDFMDAVERHTESKKTPEQLTTINNYLPSLFYYATQNSLTPHPLRSKLVNTVEYLIRHNSFFPKNLKVIFYRLLDLGPDSDRLQRIFSSMHPTHKVYFLLSVYGRFKSRNKHRKLLENLTRIALADSDVYVWGFAVAIASKLGMDLNATVNLPILVKKMPGYNENFGLIKWLAIVDYLDLPADMRKQIRDFVGPKSPDILKLLVLNNLIRMPTDYVDRLYLDSLVKASEVFHLPTISRLIASATDQNDFFHSLLKAATSRLAFKPLVVAFIKKSIFDNRASSGIADLENLKSLYHCVLDDELKQVMLNAVSRIKEYSLAYDKEFSKNNKELARYNECYFFETDQGIQQYDYLEIVPENRLRKHINHELDRFKEIFDDLVAKNILPTSMLDYDSGKCEFRIKISKNQHYELLNPNKFSFTAESMRRALILAADLYKKAFYFQRLTGKAPLIKPENLLVDFTTNTVVFCSIGRSLCSPYIFEGTTVGNEEADIAKMIAILLKTLFFKNETEATLFTGKKHLKGLEIFLALFIKNMSGKEPTRRYSCSRFSYLVEQVTRSPSSGLAQEWLILLYLRERLKGALYKYNVGRITWNGICRAVNDHLSNHIRFVIGHEELRSFPFRSRMLLLDQDYQKLHKLSQYLLDLAFFLKDFEEVKKMDASYCDLVEFLLLYASVCIEVVALGRSLRSTSVLQNLSSSTVLKEKCIRLKIHDYSIDIASADIAALILQEPKEKAGEAITGLSLRQLAIQAIFACKFTFNEATINISRPENMHADDFDEFAYSCLFRIPQIESAAKETLEVVFMALQSGDDLSRLKNLDQLRDDVRKLTHVLKRVRANFNMKRRYGLADGRDFPDDVRCRSWFHRTHIVKDQALPGDALTNSFPSSRGGYVSSWDLKSNTVTNLVIPSEGVNSLMDELKKGKLFGFKVSYLYSGKVMLIWDIAIVILSFCSLVFFEYLNDSKVSHAWLNVFFDIVIDLSSGLLKIFVVKLILYDLRYWLSWYPKLVKNLRELWRSGNAPV